MSRRILVTYTSRYGSTRRYAQWIASALNAEVLAAQKVKAKDLDQYDVVVYGGGLYAGGIAGVKLVTQHPCKHLIVFTVGLADPHTTDYSAIINKNFTPQLLASTKFFHLRGGMDYKKLGPVHRAMMAMMNKVVERKPVPERDAQDQDFLDTYNKSVHFEDEESIDSLVAYVNGLSST